MLKSKQFQYEIKYSDTADWKEVSEAVFLQGLLDSFYPVSPEIIKMLRGREVATASAKYRILLRPKAKGIFIPDRPGSTQSALI
jgi:hypothetical protein